MFNADKGAKIDNDNSNSEGKTSDTVTLCMFPLSVKDGHETLQGQGPRGHTGIFRIQQKVHSNQEGGNSNGQRVQSDDVDQQTAYNGNSSGNLRVNDREED